MIIPHFKPFDKIIILDISDNKYKLDWFMRFVDGNNPYYETILGRKLYTAPILFDDDIWYNLNIKI